MRPETLRALQLYVEEHVHPGSFLEACLANDAWRATGLADAQSLAEFGDVLYWIFVNVPIYLCGSYETVRAWVDMERACTPAHQSG